MKNLTIVGLWLLMIGITPVSAQKNEILTRLQKIGQYMSTNENLSVSLTYNMYKGKTGRNKIESEKGVLFRQGDHLWASQLGILTVQQNGVSLTIDTANQVMSIEKVEGVKEPLGLEGLTRLVSVCDTVYLRDHSNGQYSCTFEFSEAFMPEYQRISFFADQQTHRIEKIVYLYRHPFNEASWDETTVTYLPRLEVEFDYVSQKPQGMQMDLSNYVVFSGETWKPIGDYQNYQLINQQ